MRFIVATWNVNSVRLRFPQVERFLARQAPHVLCMQETKCPDDRFPRAQFERVGYRHIALHGQKGWHGVALVSKLPFADIARDRFCERNDAPYLGHLRWQGTLLQAIDDS